MLISFGCNQAHQIYIAIHFSDNYRKAGFQMIHEIVNGPNCVKLNGVSNIQLSGESLTKAMVRL